MNDVSDNIKAFVTGLSIGLLFAVVTFLFMIPAYKDAKECKAEAQAWYSATITQADEMYYWLARGQEGMLDFGVSHQFIATAHELQCIDTQLPPG
jgi:hypothetical protein